MKKASKGLKIAFVVLVVVLLAMISFIGIYNKSGQNLLPDYLLGRNIEGSRVIKFSLKASEDGNNQETTEADFIQSKEILEKRLNALGVSDYQIRLNNETGDIIIELPDDSKADTTIEYLSYMGKFEVKDADSGEVLLNNEDINSVKVGYGSQSSTSNNVSVYLNIQFDKEGAKKLLDISNQYVKTTDEEGNEIEKDVSLMIEDEEITKTYFSEPMNNGQLQLSMGSATSDNAQLQQSLSQASGIAVILDNGKLPVSYEIAQNEYVKSDITHQMILIAVYILIGIIIVDMIYLIIRYKKLGILSAISYTSSIAILLLLIRVANTVLVLESIVGFLVLILLNHYLYTRILGKLNKDSNPEEVKRAFKEVYKSCLDLLIVLLIISVVFVYITLASINGIGMLLFWGIISILIANFAIGRTLLIFGTEK